MSNPNRQVFEYRGQLTAEYYNQFFNPNLCHVCKTLDRGNLILCNQCYLISYCNEEHKAKHHMEHAKICAIIAHVQQVKPQSDTRKFSNWQQWIQSRKELMESIQQKYARPMEPYMKQMILWAKSCVVCHKQVGLQICQRCYCANYCDEHANVFRTIHNEATCDRMTLSLNIDIETISGKTSNVHYDFFPFVNPNRHFEEMLEFCMELILMHKVDLDWLAVDYVQSDYLSGPLTVYSGLQRINKLNYLGDKYVLIHIIAANSVDINSSAAWEALLHLLPKMQILKIVMIGPELMMGIRECELCYKCKSEGKSCIIFCFPNWYHDFIRTFQSFKKPNIIVGFHVEISKEEPWLEVIKEIQISSSPLFLSSSCVKKAQKNIIRIKQALGINIEPIFNQRNHFAGLAPHRYLETGDTCFRNEHLIIYENLNYFDHISSATSYK